jgi:hypothetical protein
MSTMRTMFGYSGFVGLAQKLVFLEGQSASTDRRVFIQMFSDHAEMLRFIPVSSADSMLKLNRAILAVIGETLGYAEFYLIRDRDYLPDAVVAKYQDEAERLFVLQRHEIENYLLDAVSIAETCNELLGRTVTPTDVDEAMRAIVVDMAGIVLRDMVAARLNSLKGWPQ